MINSIYDNPWQPRVERQAPPAEAPSLKNRIAEAVGRALGHLIVFTITLASAAAAIAFGAIVLAVTLPLLVIALPVVLALKALGFYKKQPENQTHIEAQTIPVNIFNINEEGEVL